MKKALAFLSAFLLCTSMVGCGKVMCSVEGCGNEAIEDTTFEDLLCSKHLTNKKAFVASKAAYDNIDSAYEIAHQFGTDIYEAWRLGIYEDDEIIDEGASHLASTLNLDEDEIRAGIAHTVVTKFMDTDWEELSDESKNVFIEESEAFFSVMEDEMFSFCVWSVIGAYIANGKVEEAQTALAAAKIQMKELSQEYSDYEHYPNLKGYYTTTSSFFDFCNNPTGSFEQVKDTINDYKNDARDYRNDLDYIFE